MLSRLHSLRITAACLAIMSGMLSSCVKEVTLDAGDRTVVVECVLSNEDVQELSLSFSRGTSETAAMELTDAVATLIDLTENRRVGEFIRGSDGKWRMDYAAVPLHRYRLEVKVPGHELIYAEDTMPMEIPLLQWDYSIFNNFDDYSREEYYDGPDFNSPDDRFTPILQPGEWSWSEWHNYSTSFIHVDFQNRHAIFDIWVYGMRWNVATQSYELADRICIDQSRCLVEVDDYNITEEVYEAPVEYTNYPYSYDGTDYQTYLTYRRDLNGSHIHKGFLRLKNVDFFNFYLLDIWADIYDTDAALEKLVATATDEHAFTPRTNRLRGLHHYVTDLDGVVMDNYLFNEDQEYAPEYADGYLQFVMMSDAYERYAEEALFQLRRQGKESSDLSELSIYMRENIYTNVKNGAGIFAASTRMKGTMMMAPDVCVDFTKPISQP